MGRLLAQEARKNSAAAKEKSAREIAQKDGESKVVRTFFTKLIRFSLSGHSGCYTAAVPPELIGQLSGYNFAVVSYRAAKDWQGDVKWVQEEDLEKFKKLILRIEQANLQQKEITKGLERERVERLYEDGAENDWANYRYSESHRHSFGVDRANEEIAEVSQQYLDEIERIKDQADSLSENVQSDQILGKIAGDSLTKLFWGRSEQGHLNATAFDEEFDAVFLRHICGPYVQGILNDSEKRIKEQVDKGQSFVVLPLEFCNRPSPAIFVRLMGYLGYKAKIDSQSITLRWG